MYFHSTPFAIFSSNLHDAPPSSAFSFLLPRWDWQRLQKAEISHCCKERYLLSPCDVSLCPCLSVKVRKEVEGREVLLMWGRCVYGCYSGEDIEWSGTRVYSSEVACIDSVRACRVLASNRWWDPYRRQQADLMPEPEHTRRGEQDHVQSCLRPPPGFSERMPVRRMLGCDRDAPGPVAVLLCPLTLS